MEILFIICSRASSTLISAFLSLRLAFLFIASCFISSDGDEFPLLRFYQGSVTHVWRNRRHNPFEYPVCYALLNLDRACSSHSSALPSSLFPRSFFADKLSPDNARALTGTNGPVLLLTIPPSMGHGQNPFSIYYCYDGPGKEQRNPSSTRKPYLRTCIVEVTNTAWGEKASFVFDPNSDLVAKPLHASSFMDILGNLKMEGDEPGKKLSFRISVQHPEMGDYLTATLSASLIRRKSVALYLGHAPKISY